VFHVHICDERPRKGQNHQRRDGHTGGPDRVPAQGREEEGKQLDTIADGAEQAIFLRCRATHLGPTGYFSSVQGDAPGSYRLAQNYIWDNRGGFTRSIAHDEGESVLLSVPLTADEGGEVRFVSVPPRMRLKKEKASRLDINLETQSLSVKYRDANESEATEEREKMATVLSDQIGPANEVGLVFQDGEWQIRDPQSRPGSFAASPQRVPASPVEQLSLEG